MFLRETVVADSRPRIKVGPDTVHQEDNRLIIYAAQAMDWPIREFSRVPIYVLGNKYYLRTKRPGDRPPTMVYELWPWPDNQFDKANTTIVYDVAYVTHRDQVLNGNRKHQLLYYLLLPLYPFLGLCWSGFKDRTLGMIGFEQGATTRISIFVTLNLFFIQGIMLTYLGGGFFKQVGLLQIGALDWIACVFLMADVVIRYSQSLQLDGQRHWGLGEWLLPAAWRD